MSNLSDFFGAADSSGDIYTNPEAMMLQRIDNSSIGFWSGGTFVPPTNALMWTGMGQKGAYVNVGASYAANTYYTLLDVTGQGFCNHWFSWLAGTQGNGNWTSRVTMDGKVYTLVTPTFNVIASHRALYGSIGQVYNNYHYAASSWINGENNNNWLGSYKENRDVEYYSSGGGNSMLPTYHHLARNGPALRFKTGLKIEMKCNVVGASTASYNSFAGAVYSMTGDVS